MRDEQEIVVKELVEENPITKVIKLLQSVDLNNPEAELNKISISDGKNGRIYF